MSKVNPKGTKKNALYCPDRAAAQLVEDARVFSWADAMPWFSGLFAKPAATVRPGMRLIYDGSGGYQVTYTQDLDPTLLRMRWTCRFIALDAGGEQLFDFVVDTRELTVHPETKRWVYQSHTGDEVRISRHLAEIATWARELSGNAWFKEA